MSVPARGRWSSAVAEVVLIALFLTALVLPVADRFLVLDHAPPLIENRRPHPMPEAPRDWSALRAFPPAFESHWNDNFGFRRTLVRLYDRISIGLGTSPLPDRVVVGDSGWLFYAAERALEDYRGERPFEDGELLRWQYLLETRRDWLADRGILYLFVLAPSKETIYAEHMPRRIGRGAVHRIDQLLAYLAARSDVRIIDPRALLAARKQDGDLYRKTDTHWNSRGALVADEAIMSALAGRFPALTPLPASAFRNTTLAHTGDLVQMLGLIGFLEESAQEIVLAQPRAREIGGPGSHTNTTWWTEIDDPSLPRGVFFHDSFGQALAPFLAEHFRDLRHMWMRPLDPDVVSGDDSDALVERMGDVRDVWMRDLEPAVGARENPEVVIHEMAERFLFVPPPPDSAVLCDNSRVRARWAASSAVAVRVPGTASVAALTRVAVEPGPVLRVTEAAGAAQISPVEGEDGSSAVVRAEIESPGAGRVELFYQTRRARAYDTSRNLWAPLHPGSNVLWFLLPEPGLAGTLRIDLSPPGRYRLVTLEARSVAPF